MLGGWALFGMTNSSHSDWQRSVKELSG